MLLRPCTGDINIIVELYLKSHFRAGNEEERMMKKARKNKRTDEASIKK